MRELALKNSVSCRFGINNFHKFAFFDPTSPYPLAIGATYPRNGRSSICKRGPVAVCWKLTTPHRARTRYQQQSHWTGRIRKRPVFPPNTSQSLFTSLLVLTRLVLLISFFVLPNFALASSWVAIAGILGFVLPSCWILSLPNSINDSSTTTHHDHRTHMYIQLDHKCCPNAPHCPLIHLVLVDPLPTCTNTPKSTLKHKCTRVLANTAPGIRRSAINILQKGATHPVVPLARAFAIPIPRCEKPARPCPARPTPSNRTWIWGRHRGITVQVLNRLGFKR